MKADTVMRQAHALKIEEYHVESEPYYEPVGEEIALTDDAVNELSRSLF
ncbi:MAG: hypothetical protein HKM22_00905 [Gammaproteobacteria bacterium]|nr:hypothetical protein [Gammaproteobacteria bacterium]